jgi:Flp pilus assembly protein TadG
MLKRALHRLASPHGVAALEFAIMLPVLLLLIFGGFEGFRLIMAYQRVDRVAGIAADLASRLEGSATEGDITNMLDGAMEAAKPFPIAADGRIILSAIDNSGPRKILWQRCRGAGTLASSIGTQNTNATMTGIRRTPSSTDLVIFVAEVKMKYTPPLQGLVYDEYFNFQRQAVVPSRGRVPTAIVAGGPISGC